MLCPLGPSQDGTGEGERKRERERESEHLIPKNCRAAYSAAQISPSGRAAGLRGTARPAGKEAPPGGPLRDVQLSSREVQFRVG